MITEFRKSLQQYLMILIFFSTLLVVFIFTDLSPIGFLSPLTKLLLFVFSLLIAHTAAAIISSKTGNKEFQSLAYILMQECDADLFFQQSGPLFKKGSDQANLAKFVLLGNGYVAQGNYSKALNLLDNALTSSDISSISEEMKANLCVVYRNACISLVETKQYKKAISTYSSLSELSQTINVSAKLMEEANNTKLLTRDYVGVFTKPTMDTTYLEESFNSSPTKYMKLLLANLLKRHFHKVGSRKKEAFYSNYISKSKTECFSSLSEL